MTAGSPVVSTTELSDRTKLAQDKARVLREALPWMTRWAGRTVVVKYGGNVADARGPGQASAGDESLSRPDPLTASFAADVALLRSVGVRVVVVHGGGPQISALSQRLGLRARFVDGRRVTDEATLDVVRLVLLGQVNPLLVGLVSGAGARAVGVAGTDGGLLVARPADPALGLVGDVDAVDTTILSTLLDDGAVPVVATVARGRDGRDYNINADTAAGSIAEALDADKLIYLTNVAGLYEHFGTAESTLLSTVTVARLQAMLDGGELATGMVPKIASMVTALRSGRVARAHLLDGRVEHALLLEVFTDEGIGTMVVKKASGT